MCGSFIAVSPSPTFASRCREAAVRSNWMLLPLSAERPRKSSPRQARRQPRRRWPPTTHRHSLRACLSHEEGGPDPGRRHSAARDCAYGKISPTRRVSRLPTARFRFSDASVSRGRFPSGKDRYIRTRPVIIPSGALVPMISHYSVPSRLIDGSVRSIRPSRRGGEAVEDRLAASLRSRPCRGRRVAASAKSSTIPAISPKIAALCLACETLERRADLLCIAADGPLIRLFEFVSDLLECVSNTAQLACCTFSHLRRARRPPPLPVRLFTGELFELVHVFTHGVLEAAVTRLPLSAGVTGLHAAHALDALRGRQRPAQGIAGPRPLVSLVIVGSSMHNGDRYRLRNQTSHLEPCSLQSTAGLPLACFARSGSLRCSHLAARRSAGRFSGDCS